ncbi:MAG TPA: tetratricopeptide repeat protein [Pirellulales bacterium]|nr:tetratricopeptide repeat protein [Pirellulales bacterium]
MAGYRRAVAAIDRADINTSTLDQMQYELLYLGNGVDVEPQRGLLRAKLLIAENRYMAALEQLSIAESTDETRVRALVLAGEALYRDGRFREAGAAWVRATQLDPQNVNAYRWLGVAYYELGTVDAAMHYLQEVAKLVPTDPRPHRVMGVIWRDLDEFHNSAEAYRESLERDSTSSLSDEVRFEYAQVLSSSQEHAKALEAIRQLPSTADVLALRATCLYGLGQLDEAARLLDQVIEEQPEHFPALVSRTKIALERSEHDLATKLSRRAGELKPKSPETLNLLIATYLREGNREKAKQCEQELLDVSNRLDAYHDLVSRASADPSDDDLRFRAGTLAAELGMKEAATWWLRAAVFLDPNNEAARRALDRLSDGRNLWQSLQ